MNNKRLAVISLIFLIMLDGYVLAENIIPAYIRGREGETTYDFTFNFTSDSGCNNVLKEVTTTITTDINGIGFASLDISDLTIPPSYMCEYQDGVLIAAHIWNDIISKHIITENVTISSYSINEHNGHLDIENETGDTVFMLVSPAGGNSHFDMEVGGTGYHVLEQHGTHLDILPNDGVNIDANFFQDGDGTDTLNVNGVVNLIRGGSILGRLLILSVIVSSVDEVGLKGEAYYSTTDSIEPIINLSRRVYLDTAANGVGGSVDFYNWNDADEDILSGRIGAILTDVSDNDESSSLVFYSMAGGNPPVLGMTLQTGHLEIVNQLTANAPINIKGATGGATEINLVRTNDANKAFTLQHSIIGGINRLHILDTGVAARWFFEETTGHTGFGLLNPNATISVVSGGTTIADDWTVRSDRDIKTDIEEVYINDFNLDASLYKYKIKYQEPIYENISGEWIPTGTEDKVTREHIGLMSDEVPEECTQDNGIDLYCLVSISYVKIQQQEDEIEILKEKCK